MTMPQKTERRFLGPSSGKDPRRNPFTALRGGTDSRALFGHPKSKYHCFRNKFRHAFDGFANVLWCSGV
jgi:hypothetical protein